MLRIAFAILALLLAAAPGRAQTVLYVSGDLTTGANTGASWADAFRGPDALQRGLDAAAPIAAGGQTVQVWVVRGHYVPSERSVPGEALSVTFSLRDRVELYGGFRGNETLLEQRDPLSNVTTLSGSLGDGNRAWHVVTASGVGRAAIIDGFTVRDGRAVISFGGDGGGIYGLGASPLVRSCVVIENSAGLNGGGAYFSGGIPRFEDCRFESNVAGGHGHFGGGALWSDAFVEAVRCRFSSNRVFYAEGGAFRGTGAFVDCTFESNRGEGGGAVHGGGTFTRCSFHGNRAEGGGAIDGSALLVECTFVNNRAFTANGTLNGPDFTAIGCEFRSGGAPYGALGGGSYTDCVFVQNDSSWGAAIRGSTFVRCRFFGNTAPPHAGIRIDSLAVGCLFDGNTSPIRTPGVVVNCTFVRNSAYGGVLVLEPSPPTTPAVLNCIFWGNSTHLPQLNTGGTEFSVRNCLVQGLPASLGGFGNFDLDPRLDAQGRPPANSPCIDAGDGSALPSGVTVDLFGNPRIHDDPGMPNGGPGGPIDIGAAEFQGVSCYANCDGSTEPPVLSVADFTCFLAAYSAGAPSANCDGSTAPPRLNVQDFSCFLQHFAAGCP